MFKYKKIASLLLLAIYGIVFAHSIIPHHHHNHDSEIGDVITYCTSEQADGQHSHHHHANVVCPQHEQDILLVGNTHSGGEHEACSFEVKPVVHSELSLAFLYVVSSVEELKIPERESISLDYKVYPKKLLESYCFAVPLRAPPVLS